MPGADAAYMRAYRRRKGLLKGTPAGRRPYTPDRKLASIMLASAKYRAKRDGCPFSITLDDIVIPQFCPILGHPLEKSTEGRAKLTSPSLDKVIPALGYVPGNVRVISVEANRLKDANTVETLTALLAYCRGEL